MFRQLQLHLWDIKCNICGACELTSPKDCISTSQWRCHNCSCGEFHTVLPLNWDYPKQGSLKYCMTVNWIHTITHWNPFVFSWFSSTSVLCVAMRCTWFDHLMVECFRASNIFYYQGITLWRACVWVSFQCVLTFKYLWSQVYLYEVIPQFLTSSIASCLLWFNIAQRLDIYYNYVFLQDSLKKVEISKDGTIASLRLEKEQFAAQMDRQKQDLQQLQKELEKVRSWKH